MAELSIPGFNNRQATTKYFTYIARNLRTSDIQAAVALKTDSDDSLRKTIFIYLYCYKQSPFQRIPVFSDVKKNNKPMPPPL